MGSFNSNNSVSCSHLKFLFRALAMLGFIWILLVVTYKSEGSESSTKSRATSKAELAQDIKGSREVAGSEKQLVNRPHQLDLYHMDKRRVPNGPDPIHNRYFPLQCLYFHAYIFVFISYYF